MMRLFFFRPVPIPFNVFYFFPFPLIRSLIRRFTHYCNTLQCPVHIVWTACHLPLQYSASDIFESTWQKKIIWSVKCRHSSITRHITNFVFHFRVQQLPSVTKMFTHFLSPYRPADSNLFLQQTSLPARPFPHRHVTWIHNYTQATERNPTNLCPSTPSPPV